jgi:lipoprotein-anchoring transpeptidase ErfK/SrfK
MILNRIFKHKTCTFTLALAIGLGLFSGCNNQPKTDTETESTKKADTVKAPAGARPADDAGLTLPILNALFFEADFKAKLKTDLGLTGQQIQQLQVAANNSVKGLSEDGSDYLGSARAAKQESKEKIIGIIGQEKTDQLYAMVSQRYASGDVAGLFPTQPNAVAKDTRIVVNAPAFRMDIFEQGKLLKTYWVGIGYPEFPLPTGMRRTDTIIFNPTWTPPDEPWVRGKFQAGRKVGAGSDINPLGLIKIPIGMPSLIHGGKEADRLGNFASHGCVGLTNRQVQDFTVKLAQLGGKPMTRADVLNYAKHTGKTERVKLSTPVLVELRYETIVAEDGNLHIYRDVYERGTNTLENAKAVLQVYGVKYESLTGQEKAALTNALEQMNLDAKGNPIAESIDGARDTTIKSTNGVAAGKVARAKKGTVTRSVIGQKDIVIPIAALQGKGYPDAVDLDTGGAAAANSK